MSLNDNQCFLFCFVFLNKVDIQISIVSTEDPVLMEFYVDDVTLGEATVSLIVSVLPGACLGQSALRI